MNKAEALRLITGGSGKNSKKSKALSLMSSLQNEPTKLAGFAPDRTVLSSVSDDWKDSWSYDLFDAEDMQRKAQGIMPKATEAKYDLDDPTDRYLYENGLPSLKDNFNEKYGAAQKEAEEEAREARAYRALYSSFQNDVLSKAREMQQAEYAAAKTEGREAEQLADYENIIASVLGLPKYADVRGNFYRMEDMPEITDYDSMDEAASIQRTLEKMRENPNAFTDADLTKLIQEALAGEKSKYDAEQAAKEKAAAEAAQRADRERAEATVRQAQQIPGLYTNALGAGGGQRVNQARAALEPTREERLTALQQAVNVPDFGKVENRDNPVERIFAKGTSGVMEEIMLGKGSANETRDRSILTMTEEERAIYAYHSAKNPKSADAYLNALMPELETRYAREMAEQGKGNIGSALVTGIASGAASGVEGIGKWFSGNAEEQSIFEKTQQAYQQANQGTAAGVIGDLSYSVGNMLPSIFAAGVTGGASLASGLTMGLGSGGNAYAQAKREGYDDGQALLYGALIGTSEALLQHALGGISQLGRGGIGKLPVVKKLVSSLDGAFAKVIKNPQAMNAIRKAGGILGSMGSEGTEEYLQSVLDPIFRNVILGEENELDPLSEDKIYSFLLGGLMGGVFEGANVMTGAAAYEAQLAAQQAETRAALEVDMQSLGLDQRTSERVIRAYDSLSEGQTGKAQRSMNKLQGAVTHALEVRAEADADVNVARTQAQARLSPLYAAMQQAAQTGNMAAFQKAQARYMAEFSVQQAKAEAAKVKAANQVEAANRAIRDTAAEIEEDIAVAHAQEQLSGAAQRNGSPGENTVTGPFKAGIMNAGGGMDGEQDLQGVQGRRFPNGPQQSAEEVGDYRWSDAAGPPADGAPARGGAASAGMGRGDRAEAPGERTRITYGLPWSEADRRALPEGAQAVNETSRETAELLNDIKNVTGRDVLLFATESDFAQGMTIHGKPAVRDTGKRDMAFHAAHECAHLNDAILSAGREVLEGVSREEIARYEAYRRAHTSGPDPAGVDILEELVCDAYAAYVYEIITGEPPVDHLGLDLRTAEQFYLAFEKTDLPQAYGEEGELYDLMAREGEGTGQYSRMRDRPIVSADGTIIDPADLGDPQKENSGFPLSIEGMNPQDQAKVLVEFAKYEVNAGDTKDRIRVGQVSDRFVDDVRKASDGRVDVRGLAHYVFADGIRHGWKHNAEKGKAPLTAEDIAAIPYIINEYDRLVVTPKRGETSVKLYKDIGGTVVYVEIVGTKRGHLFTKNVWRETEEEPSRRMDSNAPHQTAEPAAFFGSSDHSIFDPEGEVNYSRMTFEDELGIEYGYQMPKVREKKDGNFAVDFTVGGKKYHLEGPDRNFIEAQIHGLKGEYAYGNASQAIERRRAALKMFREGVTVKQYYETAGDQYSRVIGGLLRDAYLKSGVDQGGVLNKGTFNELVKDLDNWKHMESLPLSFSFPQRILEKLPAWRTPQIEGNRVQNFRDGERLKDVFFRPVMEAAGDSAQYIIDKSAPVVEIVEKIPVGDRRAVSCIAQMLGEGIITEEMAGRAMYDKTGMVVRGGGTVYVFDGKGRLKAFSHGGQTAIWEDNIATRVKNTRQAVRDVLADKEFSAEGKTKMIDQLKGDSPLHTNVVVVAGDLSVTEGPGRIRVEHPKGRVFADIQKAKRPNVNAAKDLANAMKPIFHDMLHDANLTLVEAGYDYIPERKDYMPHIGREMVGVQGVIDTLLGQPDALPTAIAGLTGGFEPGKPFFNHFVERVGNYTEFDAIRGFEEYVKGVANVIHYTPVIQRWRQLEHYIRKYGGQRHANLVNWMHNYVNILASKKSDADRIFESLFGRSVFSLSSQATSMVGAASVAGSMSSSMSNLLGLLSAMPGIGPRYIGAAMADAWHNSNLRIRGKQDDGFMDQLPSLRARHLKYENVARSKAQRAGQWANEKAGFLFETIDRFAAEAAARAKYAQLLNQGYTKADAVAATDDYIADIFAVRAKGMTPSIFQVKMLRPLLQFQLEAWNQVFHPGDYKRAALEQEVHRTVQAAGGDWEAVNWAGIEDRIFDTAKGKGVLRTLAAMILMFLWNRYRKAVSGSTQAFDPVGMTVDFGKTAVNAGVGEAWEGLKEDFTDQAPFLSTFTGGRVPVMGGFGNFAESVQIIGDPEASLGEKGLGLLEGASYITKGGAQARKTAKGIAAYAGEGAYTDSGNLKFPVERTPFNFVQAVLYGPNALAPESYDWQRDTLSAKKTEQYEQLREKGFDRFEAYDLLRTMKASDPNGTKAGKLAHIATFDADDDGSPDLDKNEMNIVAAVLGIKDDKGNAVTDVPAYAKAQVNARIETIEAEEDLTKEEQEKKIEDENLRFFLTLLGK